MHRIPTWILASTVFLALSLLQACGEDSPTQILAQQVAGELAPGTAVVRTLPGSADSSAATTVTFRVDSGSTYSIRVKGVKPGDSVIILDPQGMKPYAIRLPYQSGGDSVTLQMPAVAGGLYSLRIVASGGSTLTVTESVTSGLPSTVVLPDAREPDGSRGLAHTIAPADGWIQGTLHTGSAPDQDWFRVVTDSGWTYQVEIKDSVKLYASSLELFGSDTLPLGLPAFGSVSRPSFGKDTLLVRVNATDNAGSRYRIRVTRTSGVPSGSFGADAWESDNARATAKPLATDSTVQSRTLHGYLTTSDVDWISVAVDSGRTYAIHLSRTFSSGTLNLWTGDSTRVAMGSGARSSGSRTVSVDTFPCARSGRLVLEVSAPSPGAYELAVDSRKGIDERFVPDPGEPDNDSLHPMKVTARNADVLRWLDGNDTDRVSLLLPPSTCHFTTVHNLDSLRTLLVSWKGSLQRIAPSDSLMESFCSVPADTLPVKLFPSTWTPGSRLRYRITTEDTALPPDALEPDNTHATAVSIRADGDTLWRWTMQGDEDWMRIPVTAKQNLALNVESYGEGSLKWELYDGIPTASSPQGTQLNGKSDTYTRQGYYAIASTGFAYLHARSTSSAPVFYSIVVHYLPWDSLETRGALPLAPDSSAGTALLSDMDWDGFEVPVKAGQSYAWSMRSHGGTGAFGYVDAPAGVLTSAGLSTYDSNGVFTAAQDGIATLHAELTHYRLELASPISATLRVWPIASDPSEPDNTPATARLLAIDGHARPDTLIGWTVANDDDWIRLPVKAKQNLALEVERNGPGSLAWEVYDGIPTDGHPQGSLLDRLRDTYTGKDYYAIQATGFAYVRVHSPDAMPVHYALRAQSLPGDTLEALEPQRLSPDSSAGIALLNDMDWDRFEVPVKAGQSYAWSMRSHGGTGAFGYVTGPGGIPAVPASSSGYDSSGLFTAAQDGIATMSITPTRSQLKLASPIPATVRVWSVANDPSEPNGTPATARPLTIDGPALSGVLLGDEVDAIRFPIDSASRLHIEITGSGFKEPTYGFYEVNDTLHPIFLTKASAAEGGGYYYMAKGLPFQHYDKLDQRWISLGKSEGVLMLHGTANRQGEYSVRITRVTGNDALEPDEFITRALPLDSVLSLTLTVMDADFFNFGSTPTDTGYILTVECERPLLVSIDDGADKSTPVKTTVAGNRTEYRFRSLSTRGQTGSMSNSFHVYVTANRHMDVIPYSLRLSRE